MRLSLIETILAAALAAALVFGGWNWYWKNHYENKFKEGNTAAREDSRDMTAELQRTANLTAQKVQENERARRKVLEDDLAYLRANPVVRTQLVVRDRWRTGTCPAGTPGQDGDVPGTGSGLHPELEEYALRTAFAADGVVDERNACVEMYNGSRAAILEWNRKHGR
jgi:hypothetical protein